MILLAEVSRATVVLIVIFLTFPRGFLFSILCFVAVLLSDKVSSGVELNQRGKGLRLQLLASPGKVTPFLYYGFSKLLHQTAIGRCLSVGEGQEPCNP